MKSKSDMNIKEIYCFGTSFTAGGGFEWDDVGRSKILAKYYNEEPHTQYNYSWPGQLQRIVGTDIKVINLAHNGYGFDRTMRVAYDVIEQAKSLDDKLFLFEFSWLGRKELWSNTFRDYVVANYTFMKDGTFKLDGIADRYYSDTYQTIFKTLQPKFESFLGETISEKIEQEELERNSKIFIDYLLYNKINFRVLQTYVSWYRHREPVPVILDPITDIPDILDFGDLKNPNRSKTVFEETDGEMNDMHGGFEWSKKIAMRIANVIGMNNYPIEPYTKKPYTKSLI